jgi:Holliday junction DNA helicase RuvA
MIAAVEGLLESRGPDSAIVRVGGMSLRIYVPSSSLDRLGAIGGRVRLHTVLQLKEENLVLYGFNSEEEREFFKLLNGVSGVGPRLAMAMLSHLSTEQLASIILSGDADALTRVPGVGKKTAARLALELKGKLEKGWSGLVTSAAAADNGEIVAALTALGYSAAEALRVISILPSSPELELEEKIKLALRHLAK